MRIGQSKCAGGDELIPGESEIVIIDGVAYCEDCLVSLYFCKNKQVYDPEGDKADREYDSRREMAFLEREADRV